MQREPRSGQGWMAIVGEGTAHRTAIAAHDLGFRVYPLVQLSFNRAHPTEALFQLLLGVAVGLIDGLGRFTQIVEMTELMRDIWQGFGDGTADGRPARRRSPR